MADDTYDGLSISLSRYLTTAFLCRSAGVDHADAVNAVEYLIEQGEIPPQPLEVALDEEEGMAYRLEMWVYVDVFSAVLPGDENYCYGRFTSDPVCSRGSEQVIAKAQEKKRVWLKSPRSRELREAW